MLPFLPPLAALTPLLPWLFFSKCLALMLCSSTLFCSVSHWHESPSLLLCFAVQMLPVAHLLISIVLLLVLCAVITISMLYLYIACLPPQFIVSALS